MLNELVKKWREQVQQPNPTNSLVFSQTTATLKTCADELEAALAKAWPWRSTVDAEPESGRPVLITYDHRILSYEDWNDFGYTGRLEMFWMYASALPRPKGGEDEVL